MGYRAAGADAAAAGALSGATSAVVVGAMGTAVGVAAGELAFGPEMLPIAAATLLAGALSSWLGFASGKDEDDRRKKQTKTAQARFYLSNLMASGDHLTYDDAKAHMPSDLAELLDNTFEKQVSDALSRKSTPAQHI